MKVTSFIGLICLLFGLIGGYLFSQHGLGQGFTKADAVSVSRSGSFQLPMTPDEALPLFTAPGEKLWVPNWDPIILKGDGFEKGTTFITKGHGHTSYWLVLDYNVLTRRAMYARITPGVDMGTVEVNLKHHGESASMVHVTYELTGLSKRGNNSLQNHYDESSYAEMMKKWRSMVMENMSKIEAHFSK